MVGRYYDDWAIGDTIVHDLEWTVPEADNLTICTMTHDPQPLHLSRKTTEFGQIVVNGIFTFGLMLGVSVGETTLSTLVANLGYACW